MLTKVKRIRRNTGGEARKFENIPKASQPQQEQLGKRNQFVSKFVSENIKSPELADAAKQTYTTQQVQSNELISGTSMASPTNIQDVNISKATISAPTTGTSAQTAGPGTFNVATMTGATGTGQTATAAQGTVGTQSQVGTITGSLSGTATGATATPTSSAVAQAAQGQLSAGA